MKRVLVTGATGFVGRHALVPLLKRGFEVHGTFLRAPMPVEGVVWHDCNLLDPSAVRAVMNGVRPSHLLHFAWNVEHGKYWSSPLNLAWVGASLDIVRSFRDSGGKRIVAAGTCAEYEWGDQRCLELETPLRPATLYGVTKNSLREVAECFAQLNGLSFAWGRIFLTYGPHEHVARLVPSVTRALLLGEPAECSPGSHRRDFLYVEDVAEAFAALTDSEVEGSFNVASGESTSIKEVVGTLGSITGRTDLLRLGALPERAGDPPVLVGDNGRLRRELGWSPRSTLERGLADTVAWWRREISAQHSAPRL